MDAAAYISGQLGENRALNINYPQDYVGSVKLLEDAGFSPFTDTSPFKSTIYQIFDRFVQKTGLDTTSNALRDEYLQENPSAQRAIGLYNALENTFAARGAGEKAVIVDFLNAKIDEFVTEKDRNETGTLTQEESGLTDTLFRNIDANRDEEIDAEELRTNFYNDFTQLNNVLNYFQNTPGILIDVTA